LQWIERIAFAAETNVARVQSGSADRYTHSTETPSTTTPFLLAKQCSEGKKNKKESQ